MGAASFPFLEDFLCVCARVFDLVVNEVLQLVKRICIIDGLKINIKDGCKSHSQRILRPVNTVLTRVKSRVWFHGVIAHLAPSWSKRV